MVRAGKFYQLANRENTGVWGCRGTCPGRGTPGECGNGPSRGGRPEGGGAPRARFLGGVPFFLLLCLLNNIEYYFLINNMVRYNSSMVRDHDKTRPNQKLPKTYKLNRNYGKFIF